MRIRSRPARRSDATPDDMPLIEDLLARMAQQGADFTNTFAALAQGRARDHFTNPAVFDDWATGWQARLSRSCTAVARDRKGGVMGASVGSGGEGVTACASSGVRTRDTTRRQEGTGPCRSPRGEWARTLPY